MKLLYFKEHLSCINYQINVNTGFVYYNLEKDSVSKIDNSASPCILFLFLMERCLLIVVSIRMYILRKIKWFLFRNM